MRKLRRRLLQARSRVLKKSPSGKRPENLRALHLLIGRALQRAQKMEVGELTDLGPR